LSVPRVLASENDNLFFSPSPSHSLAFLSRNEGCSLNTMVDFLRRNFRPRTLKKCIITLIAFLLGYWSVLGVVCPPAPKRPEWADYAVTPNQRAEAVKNEFKFAWKGYYKHAFPNDELHPPWNTYGNSRCVTCCG
jgi:hypothetical protein